MMIFDRLPTSLVTNPISYTGSYYLYTIPASVYSINAYLWGAGGGAGGDRAGGGALVYGQVAVTPGQQIRMIIGQGGQINQVGVILSTMTDALGGGGGGTVQGGGRTAIQLYIGGTWVEVLTAGGGGGAARTNYGGYGGNAYYTGTSQSGSGGAGGGSSTAGGVPDPNAQTPPTALAGSAFTGGSAGGPNTSLLCPGGGGGYFGGGGGWGNSGGGGGGSYYNATYVTNFGGINGNSNVSVGSTYPGFSAGVGQGYNGVGPGSNGAIGLVFSGFREADYIDFNRAGVTVATVTSQGALALGKNAPTSGFQLDVTGNANITGNLSTTQTIYASSINTPAISTLNINVSTINGQTFGQPIQSTVIGLGTAGYISSTQLYSTVTGIGQGFTGSTVGLSAATIGVSSIRSIYLSSVQGYVSSFRTDSLTVGGATGYVSINDLITGTVSTGQLVAGAGFISSLQINSLSFGPSGYIIVGDIIANSLSTKKVNTQALYANNAYVGNNSTQSAILFPGIDGTYRGTALAEQTTGVGTQELLLYKVSTTSDQIRLQTTGNIVFEAGAAARSWPSTSALATPTLYIQGSSSNVGIGTAAPAATLDVAGTGRFQILSSYTLNVSSINGILPGAAFNGSTMGLSSATINTSTLGANTAKISTLALYNTLNMNNNPITNIFSALFAPTYVGGTNPNATAGGNIYGTFTSNTVVYAYHIFTTTPTSSFIPVQSITNATVLVVGGGAGGGSQTGGGGGAGGATLATSVSITAGTYTVTVGAGGAGSDGSSSAINGGNSSFNSIVGTGGGAGGAWPSYKAGSNGGCGGGGSGASGAAGTGSQGYGGGTGSPGGGGGGGGGMGSAGGNASQPSGWIGGNGGDGLSYAIANTTYLVSGGGGGGSYNAGGGSAAGTGGTGGGGNGAMNGLNGSNATYYGGGGGGGAGGGTYGGGSGYQGIVIIQYALNQFSGLLGAVTVGTITGDATYNLSIQPVNSLSLVGNTQVTGVLAASSISTSFINTTTISTQALTISSINGQTFGAPIQSTVIGLGTAGYVSAPQLAATSNYFRNLLALNVSSAISTATLYTSNTSNYFLPALSNNLSSAASTLGLYTSNTSNYFQNLLALNVSSAISTATLFTSNTSNYILSTNQSSFSTAYVTAVQGYISSLIVDSLAIGSNSGFINMGDLITTSLSSLQINTGLLTASGAVCTPQITVSSINGQQPLTLQNLTSTVTGTNSNISSMIDPTELTSTVTGLGTANFISTVGLTSILASTVTGVNTTIAAMIDPIELASSITGLGTVGFISSIGLDAKFASTTAGLGSATYLSSAQLISTVIGLGTAGYASTSYVLRQISSFSTAMGQVGATFTGSTIYLSAAIIQTSTLSTVQLYAQNVTSQAVSTNALIFGSGTGTLLMPDIAPNTIYTSTTTTSNLQVGWTSNQSPIQFYGYGTYSNTVIVEQSTGTTTQELFVFRGSNAADRIRFQTTGYMAIETGVSSRLYTAALSNATPAVMIDINSNVGIQLATPATPLDVGGTARAITLSSLTIQTSTIGGAIFTSNLYANAKTFLLDEVSTSFLLGNYNTTTFKTAGTQRATFTQAGNFGIGTPAPTYLVDIAGTTRVSTLYYSTSISYNNISAPYLETSSVNTVTLQTNNASTGQINTSTIYGRWNDAQYYVLQTL